jgi:GNAT superfamily N-acetyltransferase
MSQIRVRKYDARRDLDGLYDLAEVAYAEDYARIGRPAKAGMDRERRTVALLSVLERALPRLRDVQPGFVCEADGELVSVVLFARVGLVGDRWSIETVATHPDHRRQGLASALLKRAVESIGGAGWASLHAQGAFGQRRGLRPLSKPRIPALRHDGSREARPGNPGGDTSAGPRGVRCSRRVDQGPVRLLERATRPGGTRDPRRRSANDPSLSRAVPTFRLLPVSGSGGDPPRGPACRAPSRLYGGGDWSPRSPSAPTSRVSGRTSSLWSSIRRTTCHSRPGSSPRPSPRSGGIRSCSF